jgi:G patch domain-containing protein 1
LHAVKEIQAKMSYHKRSRAAFESDNAGPPPHAPFALYGTPLPPYDPDPRDDGSYVPVWKQEVTDERGRKRLHGAFTGGFSAGYFNTVGSKEGWTPSTFVSSRSNRAKDQKQAQRPEDFMDEEDLAEQAEAQKIETQGQFAGLGTSGGNASGGGMFADLFKTSGETMGVKLLQKMGWRQGQGVGAKVRRRAQGDKTGEAHLFAPENSRMISFNRKTDRKGLGFPGEGSLGMNRASAAGDDDEDERDARILQANRSKVLNKPKKKKTGFGVGVLNDTGSDDEDPYAIGPRISYNRIIGKDRKKKGGLTSSNANPTVEKPVFTSKKLTQRTASSGGFRKCHDGRLPLEGFVLSLAPLTISDDNKYPPPEVPEGWKPAKASITSSANPATFQSTADAAKSSTLDPKARAAMLGEQQLPGKSVFDFLSSAARDRLATASGNANLPQARGEGAPAGYEVSEAEKRKTLWDLVPHLDKQTAAAALHRGKTGWMPYAEDEGKRERYRYFLELRAGQQSNLPERPKNFSVDEWAKELREFTQAAEVFKPISGLMASRFTTSSSAPKLASDAPDSQPAPPKKDDNPAVKAAKMGMYGPLTRSTQDFFPSRLLCKRFGVKPPVHVGVDPSGQEGGVVDVSKRLDVVSQASLDQMVREARWNVPSPAGKAANADVAAGGEEEEVDVERNEAIEGQRAGEAVFKAIFGDEDE